MNTIFLADDDEEDHEIFSAALRAVDPSAILFSFYTGVELLTYLNSAETKFPDFIFLDINMPGNQDLETFLMIKRTDRLKNLPLVLYSTSISDGHREIAILHGVHKTVTKPVSFDKVKEALSSILNP